MDIDKYKILISNLPVSQQCFKTNRTTWEYAEKEISWLKQLNDNLFGDQPTLTISRQDIFETTKVREKIIKTLYWGYKSGMRGNNFVYIIKCIESLEDTFEKLIQADNLTTEHFNNISSTFKDIPGLGLSTYSKLLYFLKLTFNGNPCLILDQRLINVFASDIYSDFQELNGIRYGDNAEKKYLDYLRITNEVSKKINSEGENIEQFLFIFGNNLKH